MRIVGVSVPVLICILCVSAAAGAQDLGEALVVTATRTPEANAPSNVTVIEGAAIRDSKALDEALRADPSFGLFRRNSSLVADPSSQGVTLRGLGPSGVSRALVLEDGVPLNDGFGGWVYWGAVPRLGIARVEIAPGASSALFGSSAMGGVVEIVSRAIVDRAEVELQGGSFGTGEAGPRRAAPTSVPTRAAS